MKQVARAKPRRHGRAPGVAPRAAVATRVLEIGFTSILFAVPSSVLTGAMGPYDEPKAWALVTLVGLTAFAWLAARVFGAPQISAPRPDRWLRAVRWLLVVYAGWWACATVLSVAPGLSLWGGFGRGFGLVCFLAAFALFFVVQAEVRTLASVGHLVDRALIGSLPVVVFALGQALGWDPFPPGWDPATAEIRVRSTLGQHIFLGSYLIALIPLGVAQMMMARRQREPLQRVHVTVATVWALGVLSVLGSGQQGWGGLWSTLGLSVVAAVAWNWAPSSMQAGMPSRWRLAMLGSLVTAQALTLVLSTARGALIGLLTGLAASAAVLLLARGARKTLAILGVGVLVVIVFVGVLNLADSPLDGLKKVQFFKRIGSIAEMQERSPGWVRVRLWEGILSGWHRQMFNDEPLPGPTPALRALAGYGPETQILILDRFLPSGLRSLITGQQEWRAVYMFDRAHNELLDHLVTTGAIGMVLWLAVVGSIIVVGAMRLYAARGAPEAGMRLGCLAAVIGQTVEGLVGIASPMPRAIFWMAAAILTAPFPMPLASVESHTRARMIARRLRFRSTLALVACGAALGFVAVGSTRLLLGSTAYAAGTRRGIAGDLLTARREFVRSSQLVPWVPFPAEAVADVSLRLAAAASPTQRAQWLEEAQRTLVRTRWHVPSRSDLWRLNAQLALRRAVGGRPEDLREALRDFSEAARLRPDDPEILAQAALAMIQGGDPIGAKRFAENALTIDRRSWLAWAVLARSYSQLGDLPQAQRSAKEARNLAPSAKRDLVESLLP